VTVKMRMEFQQGSGSDSPDGLYLVGWNNRTGASARCYVDLFGETPMEDVDLEHLSKTMVLVLRSARHRIRLALE
jgi:hypothetical protein